MSTLPSVSLNISTVGLPLLIASDYIPLNTVTPGTVIFIYGMILSESVKREQPESPAHSQDDWSVCSPGEGEIQVRERF